MLNAALLARAPSAAIRLKARAGPSGDAVLAGVAVLLVGLTIRLPFFLTTDFPLNDGGLFYVMSREISAAHYALPAFTAYNLEDIPFAYPPLSLYLAAALSQALRVPLLAVVRYLPLVANLLTIVAFYAFATSLVRSRYTALLAAIAFAIAPRSYEWLVMGGGLTRSLGFLCAVSSLAQAKALYQRPSAWRLGLAGTLAALALLGHLEMGLFVVESYALFFLRYGRSWQGVRVSALLGAMLVGLTAPWWLTVVGTHGLAPYAAASATAGWSTLHQSWDTLLDFTLPGHPFLAIQGGIAFLGALVCALRGEPLVPFWLLAIFVLTPRSAPTEATVPLALLIGIGLTEVLSVGLLSVARQSPLLDRWHRAMRRIAPWRPRRLSFAALTVGMVAFCALVLPPWLPPHNGTYALEALPGPEREVMAWIAEHTPDTSAFLVLSPKRSWEADYILEWFPALARRKSVLTPQGAEWLPAQAHARRTCLYNRLRALPTDSLPDLEGWLARLQVAYSHVYISGLASGDVDLEPLREAFRASPGYRVLWDDPGATVLVRTDPVVQARPPAGEPAIAPDCQTLFDQSIEAQATFGAVFGDLAPRMWIQEHTRDLQTLKPLPAFPGTAFAAPNHQ